MLVEGDDDDLEDCRIALRAAQVGTARLRDSALADILQERSGRRRQQRSINRYDAGVAQD
jgi:hypothetical protein